MHLSDKRLLRLTEEYPESVEIINDQDYVKLKDISRHQATNTFDHSVRVALVAAKIAKFIRADEDSAVKVGLLHDYCLVDYRNGEMSSVKYCFYHPKNAAERASETFGLSKAELSAIKAHMFPLAIHLPHSRVALALIAADKVVAAYECAEGVTEKAAYAFRRKRISAA